MNNQSHLYKLMMEGKLFSVTKDHKEQLEKIGSPWSVRENYNVPA